MMTMMTMMKLLMVLLLHLLMPLISSAYSAHIQSNNHTTNQAVQDLIVAMEEMQKANYFTFVMLINMTPLDDDTRLLQGNITFLMPHDSTLARARIPNDGTPDFLLRHSIPSPLLFGSLLQLPTGTIIPSSLPEYMMSISNNGRKHFLLNNVRIISPNLCVSGSSIRCHGIDGVLTEETAAVYNSSPTTLPCPSTGPLLPNPSASPPPHIHFDLAPAPAPSPSETNTAPRKSGSSSGWKLQYYEAVVTVAVIICLMMSYVEFTI